MELEGTLVVQGIPQKGLATLTEEQKAVVQYKYTDTTEVAQ